MRKRTERVCGKVSSFFLFFPRLYTQSDIHAQLKDDCRPKKRKKSGFNWTNDRSFEMKLAFTYLSPPLMNSPTFRSCNLLGRSSRSKCSIRSGSSWPRFPAEPLSCLVRRLEILVKLKPTNHPCWADASFSLTAGFQLVFGEEPYSWALNETNKNKYSKLKENPGWFNSHRGHANEREKLNCMVSAFCSREKDNHTLLDMRKSYTVQCLLGLEKNLTMSCNNNNFWFLTFFHLN